MDNAHKVLEEIFGFKSFRLSQEAVIHRLLVENENAVVVFPTGGGKSLTFQVPALCLDGLTLVISPLIALMKDQVDSLVRRGIKAAHLDSTLNMERAREVKEQVLDGSIKLLYVAPERLNNEGFIDMMRRVRICLLAIDESHCISMWGASFRPEYLKIARFAKELDVERVLCLTATATPAVIGDICDKFYISKTKGVFRTPVYRPNLAFKVAVAETLDDKIKYILPLLQTRTGPSIIYVTLQKHTEEVAAQLRGHGLDCMIYHAGLSSEEREKAQVMFMESDKGIVVATIAFGMGIDKANIRQVIHLHMPKALEGYSQEVGRAGRDGQPSTCLMFIAKADLPILEGFGRGDTCSRSDLELWLREVATKEPASDKTVDFNHYQQSKVYDIRTNVLGLLYAQLELDYNHIRAVTPYYSVYTIEEKNSSRVSADTTKIGNAVRRALRAKKTVDVVELAAATGIDRADLTRKILSWEMDGYISTKPSQVRAVSYFSRGCIIS
ncbi:atp-dependent dna helicase [Moniliophthora roreri MCA 2997]|uniref:DNA 3'-5' helicase n=1 Tax=Moniliophthora roreri (strain MCA 2997) TaxID=1381753 RepID=V2X9I7_MONRO|nr:atp-dependent dna helicase [Moniliophthora roreri MCA 2997]